MDSVCGVLSRERSVQLGDKSDTPFFSKVWPEYESRFVPAVAKFARRHEFREV